MILEFTIGYMFQVNHYNPHTPEGWLHNLGTMLAMVRSQATGIPNGNHAVFLQYNIEALTLEGHTSNKRGGNFIAMGRYLYPVFQTEEIIHSCLQRISIAFHKNHCKLLILCVSGS